MIIYRIINKINGMSYIGQTTKSLVSRWNAHKNNKSFCRFLKHAIQKYGTENFEIKVLSRCDSIEEMNHREQYYIKLFNTLAPNGYNLMTGGKNRKASDETKAKMSKSQKGIKKPKSEAHKKKISDALSGKKQSPELVLKRARSCHKAIFVPELNKTFDSIKEAIHQLNIPAPSTIHRVLNGKRPNWKGLTFEYIDETKELYVQAARKRGW